MEDVEKRCPHAWEYLSQVRGELRAREGGKADNAGWYGYIYRKNLAEFEAPKLVVQVISQTARYVYDDTRAYFTGGGNGPYYGVRWTDPENKHSLAYLEALLNSKLLDAFLHSVSSPFRGGYWSYGKRFIEQIPIRMIDFSKKGDRHRHDRIVETVMSLRAMNVKLAGTHTPHGRETVERAIGAARRSLDLLVCELYRLSDVEIAGLAPS